MGAQGQNGQPQTMGQMPAQMGQMQPMQAPQAPMQAPQMNAAQPNMIAQLMQQMQGQHMHGYQQRPGLLSPSAQIPMQVRATGAR